jgi:uncharacterized protein YegL
VEYSAEISRRAPTAFVLLVDQSGSMAEPFGLDASRTKAEFVADVVNKWIDTLVLRCSKGAEVRHYFDVAVLGYGGSVRSALPSIGDGFSPIAALADHPLRIEDRTRIVDDGAGGVIDTKVKFRVWVDPRAEADTPMTAALSKAEALIGAWVQEHPSSYPPTVLNITDGQPTDGDPRTVASRIRHWATDDGNVLVLNCHISGWGGVPTFYPSSSAGLPDPQAEMLFEMSSELPSRLIEAAKGAGYPVSSGARGLGYQADAAALIKFVEIGTRAHELVVRE